MLYCRCAVKYQSSGKVIDASVKKEVIRNVLNCAAVFIITCIACALLLTAADCIPKRMIQRNVERSAGYFEEHALFARLDDSRPFTTVDNYADCILTNVIYCMDTSQPFVSTVRASYYNKDNENVNDSLLKAVSSNAVPNIDYFRYWHGSMVYLRPLFCVFDIAGIRLLLGAVLLVLAVLLFVILWRRRYRAAAVILALGMLLVNIWMAALCIEYINSLLVMEAVLIYAAARERKDMQYYRMFIISGAVTCFVDFLTTETLTLTMPLLLLLLMAFDDGRLRKLRDEMLFMLKSVLAWGISYALMFVTKWALAAAVLGSAAFSEAAASANVRLNGAVTDDWTNRGNDVSKITELSGAVWHNLHSLFMLKISSDSRMTYFITILLIAAVFAVCYVFRRRAVGAQFMVPALCLAALPYLRFLLLNNHAYLHYFFTYRAQLVTVAVMLAMLYAWIGGRHAS